MSSFVNAAKTVANLTVTENGASAYKSTTNSLVDLFGVAGSLREADTNRVERLLANAYSENALLATKMMFYARNVRGGLGERKTFRTMLRYMAMVNPSVVEKNLENIPYFGRWDDLYTLIDTPVEHEMWALIKAQLSEDVDNMRANKPISIMAKWLKSVNASSMETVRLGRLTARNVNLTERNYRKVLSDLRKYIDVVECKMSSGEWDAIDYEKVPSRAMTNYRNAFMRHGANFTKYIDDVESGDAKINSATLYPYDIFEKMGFTSGGWGRGANFSFDHYDRVLEAQWKALPDYVGEGANILVMADTSGSMSGRPVCTSVGLATYFAERNHGAYKDLFMTFSSRPSFVELKGNTLYDKIKNVPAIVENTDLKKAFELVLETAIAGHVPQDDMPKAIVVISDGEIDYFMDEDGYRGNQWGFLDAMRSKFRTYGYEIPNVIMWNVASRHDCYLATTKNVGVQFASGSSPSVFKSLIANMGKSAYDAMADTLNDPMYDRVKV